TPEGRSRIGEKIVSSTNFNPGDTFSFEQFKDLWSWRPSPDPNKTLEEYLRSQGLPFNFQTIAQYQASTGGTPFRFNPDGTVTYDPTVHTNKFSYEKDDALTEFMSKAIPALAVAGMGAGA